MAWTKSIVHVHVHRALFKVTLVI